jgi:hypothetical protein
MEFSREPRTRGKVSQLDRALSKSSGPKRAPFYFILGPVAELVGGFSGAAISCAYSGLQLGYLA